MTPPPAEPRFKVQPGGWYTAPPNTALYAAIPWATRQYQPLATRTEWSLLEYLKSLPDSKHTDDWLWTCQAPSKPAIAKAISVSVSTVKRAFKALVKKHFVRDALIFYRGSKKCKGRRIYIDPIDTALEKRKSDPNFALTNDKRVVFRGRGRWPMTPAQARDWKIQLDRVPEFQTRDLFQDEPESDVAGNETQSAPVVTMPPPQPVAADAPPDPILMALIDCSEGEPPCMADVHEILRLLNGPTTEERQLIPGWIRDMKEVRRKINQHERHSVGFFIRRRDGSVPLAKYLAQHRLLQHRAAADAAKAERYDADTRINRLAWQVQQYEETDDPVEREHYADAFSRADAAEMAKARELVAEIRSRMA